MGSERIEQDWVTEQKQWLIWEHPFVHLDCIQFFCGVFFVASLVDRDLRSNYLVSWCFYQAPYTFVELSSKISQYKYYLWLQHYPESFGLYQQINETEGGLVVSDAHNQPRSPQDEWFLDFHIITDQERSGKSSSVHHHTYRTNQRHKGKLMLGRWKLVPSNLLIMWIFNLYLCCLCRVLTGMLWNLPLLL